MEEPTDDDGTDEVTQGQGQDQGGGRKCDDETVKALEEILAGLGATKGTEGHTEHIDNNAQGGGTINWG